MEHDQNDPDQVSETPFYPSGYGPEVGENESGYDEYLELQHRKTTSFSGPIPPPQDLEYYNDILPGAAERILHMAELNAQHVRDIDNKRFDGLLSIELKRREEAGTGQRFGMWSVLAMASVAALALLLGHPVVAGTVCSTTIVGLVAVFVTGRLHNKEESSEP